MKSVIAIVLVACFLGCNGFIGEVHVDKPIGPEIRIVDPEYVVLRAVSDAPISGGTTATVGSRTYYFDPTRRILDLRNLDPRTAEIQRRSEGTPVVSIRTTDEGTALLSAWTSANIGKQLGVFVGGRLIDAPVIQSKITDMIILDGEFTKEQAQEVLARLRRGGASV